MRRIETWEPELVKFCSWMRSVGRVYGVSDCVLFCAGAVDVQTGADLAAGHRGKYSDEAGARAYMEAHGWADVDDVADSFLPRINPGLRRRGDILLFKGENGKTLGVCLGQSAMVMGLDGCVQIPSRLCLAAWRVGDA